MDFLLFFGALIGLLRDDIFWKEANLREGRTPRFAVALVGFSCRVCRFLAGFPTLGLNPLRWVS